MEESTIYNSEATPLVAPDTPEHLLLPYDASDRLLSRSQKYMKWEDAKKARKEREMSQQKSQQKSPVIIHGSARYFPNFYGAPYPVVFVDDDETQPPDPEHRIDFEYPPNAPGYLEFSPPPETQDGFLRTNLRKRKTSSNE